MRKLIVYFIMFFCSPIFLFGCNGHAERELISYFNSRPPGPTMPYENPQYTLDAVPENLPFTFSIPTNGELLGSVEDDSHKSGTILLTVQQNSSDILAYYAGLLTASEFVDQRELYNYHVFFPAAGSKATFCSQQGSAVFLEIFDMEDGAKDVRLHYTADEDVIARTNCGEPILAIEDIPFPYLAAPPDASLVGGGGGGGSSDEGHSRSGFTSAMTIATQDDLEAVNNYYLDLLVTTGWVVLTQSSTENAFESDWDFGYHETRSWLARLIVSAGDEPGLYEIELRLISP